MTYHMIYIYIYMCVYMCVYIKNEYKPYGKLSIFICFINNNYNFMIRYIILFNIHSINKTNKINYIIIVILRIPINSVCRFIIQTMANTSTPGRSHSPRVLTNAPFIV